MKNKGDTMLKIPESMDECSFFTNRVLEDKTKLCAWIPSDGQGVINVIYTCGACGNNGELTQGFNKVIKFNCQKCGKEIKYQALKKKK